VIYVQEGMFASNVAETINHFDDVVYPIETSIFNGGPDQDQNDRVLLLGLDGKGAYGGYFSPIDTLTDQQAQAQWGLHSNETDMLYINVEGGGFDTTHVVPHEFSHMLYHESHNSFEDWSWHNEGMAECAVHAVNGENYLDVQYYVQDPQGTFGNGVSLVNWQFANFDNYVLAYMFLTYAAGQAGGVAAYGDLFTIDGSPQSMDAWLQQEVGVTFSDALKNHLLAGWVHAASGPHSYNGMLTLPGNAAVGSGSFTLEPFSGAFRQPTAPVSYPGTQGPNIVYVGVNGLGEVDEVEPFDASGGALLVFNTSTNPNQLSPQPTGNPFPALHAPVETPHVSTLTRARTRMHPPPFNPKRLDGLRAWQRVALGE
jgi:hypothetical protein